MCADTPRMSQKLIKVSRIRAELIRWLCDTQFHGESNYVELFFQRLSFLGMGLFYLRRRQRISTRYLLIDGRFKGRG